MNISLPFIKPDSSVKRKIKKTNSNINRKLVKFKNDYTPIEIYNMDDAQLENLYEHGSSTERDVASEIIKARSDWDTIINKGLDDPLPKGSGVRGAPEAGSGR